MVRGAIRCRDVSGDFLRSHDLAVAALTPAAEFTEQIIEHGVGGGRFPNAMGRTTTILAFSFGVIAPVIIVMVMCLVLR